MVQATRWSAFCASRWRRYWTLKEILTKCSSTWWRPRKFWLWPTARAALSSGNSCCHCCSRLSLKLWFWFLTNACFFLFRPGSIYFFFLRFKPCFPSDTHRFAWKIVYPDYLKCCWEILMKFTSPIFSKKAAVYLQVDFYLPNFNPFDVFT